MVSHAPSPAGERVQTRKSDRWRVTCLFNREHPNATRKSSASAGCSLYLIRRRTPVRWTVTDALDARQGAPSCPCGVACGGRRRRRTAIPLERRDTRNPGLPQTRSSWQRRRPPSGTNSSRLVGSICPRTGGCGRGCNVRRVVCELSKAPRLCWPTLLPEPVSAHFHSVVFSLQHP